jgi:hypothetical protein
MEFFPDTGGNFYLPPASEGLVLDFQKALPEHRFG